MYKYISRTSLALSLFLCLLSGLFTSYSSFLFSLNLSLLPPKHIFLTPTKATFLKAIILINLPSKLYYISSLSTISTHESTHLCNGRMFQINTGKDGERSEWFQRFESLQATFGHPELLQCDMLRMWEKRRKREKERELVRQIEKGWKLVRVSVWDMQIKRERDEERKKQIEEAGEMRDKNILIVKSWASKEERNRDGHFKKSLSPCDLPSS